MGAWPGRAKLGSDYDKLLVAMLEWRLPSAWMGEVVGCLRNVDIKQQKLGGSECRDTLAGLCSRARRSYERCAAAGSRQR